MSDMPGMEMSLHPWTSTDFFMMLLMWVVMMIGMMVPTAMRTVLIYARIGAQAQTRGQSFAPTWMFVMGYVVIWSLFSVAATGLQWALETRALLSPMMVTNSAHLGAALLVFAGIYQLTPFKDACLKHCQSPAEFISSHFKKGNFGAFQLGLTHGAYCLGCCWALMGLLFVGGVMNLVWILAITLFVLVEKLLPQGLRTVRITGVAMIASGIAYLLT